MTGPRDIGEEDARRRALIGREAAVAAVASAVIGVGFFLLVFGWRAVERGALAIDCLPQVFGVTMLGGMVPSILTLRRIARGTVVPAGPVPGLPGLIGRAALCGLAAVVLLGVPGMLAVRALVPPVLAPLPAMLLKCAFGGVVGYLVTPPILRIVLGMRVLG